jgi:hypothetical protein
MNVSALPQAKGFAQLFKLLTAYVDASGPVWLGSCKVEMLVTTWSAFLTGILESYSACVRLHFAIGNHLCTSWCAFVINRYFEQLLHLPSFRKLIVWRRWKSGVDSECRVQTQFMNHTVVCNFSEGFSARLPENLQYVVNSLIVIYRSGLHKILQRFNKSFDV